MYFKLLATAEKQVERIFSGDSYSPTKNLYV